MLDITQPGITANRLRFAANQLHAVITFWVVAGRHHHAAVSCVMAGREIDLFSPTQADVDHIRAGGLVYLTAGVDYHIIPEFSLQGTINYHVDDASAWNGDLKFERFPIELIGYYQPNPVFRVGGGVRYTVSPKLSSNGNAPEANASYANTTSAVVEAEYFVEPDCGIKMRYVHETFKTRGREIDGSHIGISANFYF